MQPVLCGHQGQVEAHPKVEPVTVHLHAVLLGERRPVQHLELVDVETELQVPVNNIVAKILQIIQTVKSPFVLVSLHRLIYNEVGNCIEVSQFAYLWR